MGPNELFMVICFFIEILVLPFICVFFLIPTLFKPETRSKIIRYIIGYFCINLFLSFSNFGFICIKRSRTSARKKACSSNIRVLQGAVEMYNTDHEKTPMKTLDIKTLEEFKYLKPNSVQGPSDQCEYLSNRDLSKDGKVICRFHSDPNYNYDWETRKSIKVSFWDSGFGKILVYFWHSPLGIIFRALFFPTSLPFLLP